MKLAFNLSFFLLMFFTISEKSYSLTNYEIKKICNKEKRGSTCIRNLKDKRSKLNKGLLIEIPVVPHKK